MVKSAEDLKRRSPQLFAFHITLGDSLMMLGRFQEAQKAYAEAPADEPLRIAAEAILAARAGDRATANSKKNDLEQQYGEATSYQYAQIHAQLGNVEEAFAALERGWQIKDAGLLGMKVDPILDPLRGDARFAALLGKIGLPV